MSLRTYEAAMKAAADPTRVRILKMLEGGELCVCQIIEVLALSPSTVSKHLSLLRSAGLVKDRKVKKWVLYTLDGAGDPAHAGTILKALRGMLAGDPQIRGDRQRLARACRELGPDCAAPRGGKAGRLKS